MNIVDQSSLPLPPILYVYNAVYPYCRNIPDINYPKRQRHVITIRP